MIAAGGTLVFGSDQDSVNGGFSDNQLVRGNYQSVRIFDDVRTSAELAASQASELPAGEAGMLAQWTFDNLSTDGVITESVNGNNLIVIHKGGAGFIPSEAELVFSIEENAAAGSVVGQVAGVDANDDELSLTCLLYTSPSPRD